MNDSREKKAASGLVRAVCPGCGGSAMARGVWRDGQPVIQNYLCGSADMARALRRGTEQLIECDDCGLVFNGMFDIGLVGYDELYDGQQEFSGVFRDHMDSVAGHLAGTYLAQGGRVLDIGCGKGGFLRLLRDKGCRRCVGYDTSCPEKPGGADEGIDYHRSYVTAEDIRERFDLIVCRHVVCQVDRIGDFLHEMARIAEAAGGAAVAIETPDFEWIAEHGSFWDVFYERCNYFTRPALAGLCERAGFEVLRHECVFGGQYQLIEMKPGRNGPASPVVAGSLKRYEEERSRIEVRLSHAIRGRRPGSGWAIWGAGGKGVTLANVLGDDGLLAVIDANPAKQGGYIPGIATGIIGSDDDRIADLGLVLIANPNYEEEIRETLSALGFAGEVQVV